ncbi:hypothetical protein MKX01_040390 [Papaver californicum]|nr:hypothetical protein MKX01_040390 [Papaver californicum]
MACRKLGSKSESFRRQGQTWLCATGIPSDVIIEVGDMSFHLHKFPLLSRSAVLEKLIEDLSAGDGPSCVWELHDMPGGAQAFALVAKFCYGVKIELTSQNVVSLRCAAEHLQMNESYGEGNLIEQTEDFLNDVFGNWADSLKALAACDEVLPHAEEVHIVSRCINYLATKACADPSAFCWPRPGGNNKDDPQGEFMWNGICTGPNPQYFGEDWWYQDVSLLSLPLYKIIAGSIMFYGKRYLPGVCRHPSLKEHLRHANPTSSVTALSEADQRFLLEEIMELLPNEKGVTLTRFLLRLLRIAMLLHASPSCRENLEKRVGTQLDQATLDDLLIPNMGFTVETLYDVDCVQRILDHFTTVDQRKVLSSSPCIIKEEYEEKEEAHPWLVDSEKEQFCRLMNCQKLSLEDCTHAAQNERLPLRVIVQVLFFEQLRLRTSVAGWFFVSDNIENSHVPVQNLPLFRNNATSQSNCPNYEMEDQTIGVDEMRLRVLELEKECSNMKLEIEKMEKTKSRSWNILSKLGLKKLQANNSKTSKPNSSNAPPNT